MYMFFYSKPNQIGHLIMWWFPMEIIKIDYFLDEIQS